MQVSFRQAKAAFFDRQVVQTATDKARLKVLGRFGAFVRSDAQRSIRTRKKASNPGTPPSNQTGVLKKFIFFSYDAINESVIVGPVRLSGHGGPDTLQALEHGGRFTRRRTNRRKRTREPYQATYPARPFMRPALEKNQSKLAGMLRDAIR